MSDSVEVLVVGVGLVYIVKSGSDSSLVAGIITSQSRFEVRDPHYKNERPDWDVMRREDENCMKRIITGQRTPQSRTKEEAMERYDTEKHEVCPIKERTYW